MRRAEHDKANKQGSNSQQARHERAQASHPLSFHLPRIGEKSEARFFPAFRRVEDVQPEGTFAACRGSGAHPPAEDSRPTGHKRLANFTSRYNRKAARGNARLPPKPSRLFLGKMRRRLKLQSCLARLTGAHNCRRTQQEIVDLTVELNLAFNRLAGQGEQSPKPNRKAKSQQRPTEKQLQTAHSKYFTSPNQGDL